MYAIVFKDFNSLHFTKHFIDQYSDEQFQQKQYRIIFIGDHFGYPVLKDLDPFLRTFLYLVLTANLDFIMLI